MYDMRSWDHMFHYKYRFPPPAHQDLFDNRQSWDKRLRHFVRMDMARIGNLRGRRSRVERRSCLMVSPLDTMSGK